MFNLNQNSTSEYTMEVLNFDVVPCIYHTNERKTNWKYPINWHNDLELIYCLDGELDIRINENIYTARPGNIYIFNSQDMHNITSKTYGKHSCLIISEDFCKKCLIDVTKTRFFHFIEKDDELTAGFELLEKHFLNFTLDRVIGIHKAVSDILYTIYTQYQSPELPEKNVKTASADRVKTVIAYLNKHYDENITLDFTYGMFDSILKKLLQAQD